MRVRERQTERQRQREEGSERGEREERDKHTCVLHDCSFVLAQAVTATIILNIILPNLSRSCKVVVWL